MQRGTVAFLARAPGCVDNILIFPGEEAVVRHFYVSVRANSPLAIRSDHAEGGAKIIQYITGTTVLGSLASAHRRLRAEPKDVFTKLFPNEGLYFSHLYPASFTKSKSGRIDTSKLIGLPLH